MSNTPILESLGLLATEPACERAAQQAQRIAAQTGTPLVIWRDGRVVTVPPQPVSTVQAAPLTTK